MKILPLVGATLLGVSPFAVNAAEFKQVSKFETYKNYREQADQDGDIIVFDQKSAPEIVDATEDGKTLVYTNSELGSIGFVDISNPSNPIGLGEMYVDGEPTSVAVRGDYAVFGVNTSESYTNPSGKAVFFKVSTQERLFEVPLIGQPDSVAISPDGSFAVIAIENERNEDINDEMIPQLPEGLLAMLDMTGDVHDVQYIDLTGLADIAPSDPEPEFVDVNDLGETVITLQENNHLAVVDKDGNILNHFSAGWVELNNIDTKKDGVYNPVDSRTSRREPDAVVWIDNDHFATANEGDYKLKGYQGTHKRGGSRGWTIWNKDGTVVYESGATFETALAEAGFWPDKRAGKKGVEPESVTVGTFDGTRYIFVGAERADAVGVYDATDLSNPILKQILPSGIAPEGLKAIPSRNLFVTSNEKDKKVRGNLTIFQF